MRHGMQELAGEVARLRQECTHFIRLLDELEKLSNHPDYLSEEQSMEIERVNHVYSGSAKDNLERATSDLRNWWDLVDRTRTGARSWLGY